MCGGRDFDRLLVDNVVKPWLLANFDLPEDLAGNPKFKRLIRVALAAAERAKIELYSKEEAIISSPENEISVGDQAGQEIYLDVPIQRPWLSLIFVWQINLITNKINMLNNINIKQ
jgi:molecular chaperone DnaK